VPAGDGVGAIMIRRRDFITGAAALAASAAFARNAVALTPVQTTGELDRLPEGFYNFTGSNLANWQRALTAQRRGAANAIIGCLGDSTVAGQGAAGNELASNAKSLSWPTQLAKLIPDGSWSSVWGDNNIAASAGILHAFDARLSRAGWTIRNNKSNTLCGGFFHGQSSAATHSFTPTNPIDTIEIWYVRSPGYGYFTIDVDGGSPLATISCTGPDAFLKTAAICQLGLHRINLTRTAADATDIYLTALRAYNSAVKEVSVYNLGGCRWGSADFIANQYPWNTLPAMTAIAPNLVFFEAGIINDWNDKIPLATVTSNMKAVIKALKAVNCDIMLMSGAPSEATGYYPSYTAQAAYVDNMKSLAYAANVPFIDVWGLWGGKWSKPAMFDSLHPNGAGYGLIAGYARTAALNPSARSVS